MKLNPHSRLAKFYRNFYNTADLPNNLCDYFWKLIFAIVLYPLVCPVIVINNLTYPIKLNRHGGYSKSYARVSTSIGILMTYAIMLIGYVLCKIFKLKTQNWEAVFTMYCMGIFAFACSVLAFILLWNIGVAINKSLPKRRSYFYMSPSEREEHWKKVEEEQRKRQERKERSLWNLTKQRIKAAKDKNCPMIEWEYKTNETK